MTDEQKGLEARNVAISREDVAMLHAASAFGYAGVVVAVGEMTDGEVQGKICAVVVNEDLARGVAFALDEVVKEAITRHSDPDVVTVRHYSGNAAGMLGEILSMLSKRSGGASGGEPQ